MEVDVPVKRGRGRPRKNAESENPPVNSPVNSPANPVKRGRGRPPKAESAKAERATRSATCDFDGSRDRDRSYTVCVQRKIPVGDSVLVLYRMEFADLRFTDELLYPAALHSMEHLLRHAFRLLGRDGALRTGIVEVLPCGSRTGLLLLTLNPTENFTERELRDALLLAVDTELCGEDVLAECRNPRYQDAEEARRQLKLFLENRYQMRVPG